MLNSFLFIPILSSHLVHINTDNEDKYIDGANQQDGKYSW